MRGDHQEYEGLRQRNQSPYIDTNLLRLIPKRRVEEVFDHPKPGIVDQYVDPNIAALYLNDQTVDRLHRRKGCGQNGDLYPVLFAQCLGQLIQLFCGTSHQDKAGPLLSQLSCESFA